MSEDYGLKIVRDKLIRKYRQVEKEEQSNVEEDITDQLPQYLAMRCDISEGTTLRDIFKLCQKHADILSTIEGRHFFRDYLELAFSETDPFIDLNTNKKLNRLEHLKCFKLIQVMRQVEIPRDVYVRTNFGTKNHKVEERVLFKKGDTIQPTVSVTTKFTGQSIPDKEGNSYDIWIEGHNLHRILDIPICVDQTIKLYDTEFDIEKNDYECHIDKLMGAKYHLTLLEIIDAVFSTLGRCGTPEESYQLEKKIISEVNTIELRTFPAVMEIFTKD